jgi:hypothetical protein
MVVEDFPYGSRSHKPYVEHKLNNGKFLRTFSKDVLAEELVWHRDRENRIIEVVEGEGWEIQFDDKLPEPLVKGKEYVIPAYTFHRIKRGTTDLVVTIEEH